MQSINYTSVRLGNLRLLTVFSGLPQDSHFIALLEDDGPEPVSMSSARARQIISIEELSKPLEQMHPYCAASSSKKGNWAIDSHNRKTGIRAVDFGVREYVLQGSLEVKQGPNVHSYGQDRSELPGLGTTTYSRSCN